MHKKQVQIEPKKKTKHFSAESNPHCEEGAPLLHLATHFSCFIYYSLEKRYGSFI